MVVHYLNNRDSNTLGFSYRDYFSIFKYTGNSVFNLSETNSKLDEERKTILSYISDNFQIQPEVMWGLEKFIVTKNINLYSLCKKICWITYPNSDLKRNVHVNRELFWNKLFRMLGYDAILDPIGNLMFAGESAQFCALKPNVIKMVEIFKKSDIESYPPTITNKNWSILLNRLPSNTLVQSIKNTYVNKKNVTGLLSIFAKDINFLKESKIDLFVIYEQFPELMMEFPTVLDYFLETPRFSNDHIVLLENFDYLTEAYKKKVLQLSSVKNILNNGRYYIDRIAKFEPYM